MPDGGERKAYINLGCMWGSILESVKLKRILKISLLGLYVGKEYFRLREELEQRARVKGCATELVRQQESKTKHTEKVIRDEVGKVEEGQIMKF